MLGERALAQEFDQGRSQGWATRAGVQAAPMNQQHATATLGHRLLDESLGLVSRRVRGQMVQVQFGLGHNLSARERVDQIVGHAKSRAGQLVAFLFNMQGFPRRPRARRRGLRWLFRLPIGHYPPGPGRQRPHTLHGGLEKPALFFLGRVLAFG